MSKLEKFFFISLREEVINLFIAQLKILWRKISTLIFEKLIVIEKVKEKIQQIVGEEMGTVEVTISEINWNHQHIINTTKVFTSSSETKKWMNKEYEDYFVSIFYFFLKTHKERKNDSISDHLAKVIKGGHFIQK